jgi:HlyD family secretion protein
VLVVRDKRAIKQFVTLGLLGDARLEVLQGVAKGEGVIPKSKLGIKAGQRVRARVAAEPPPTAPRAAGKRPMEP